MMNLIKMWLFKRKISEEEFKTFEKRVQNSFDKVKAENSNIQNQLDVLTKVTMTLVPLSKRFTELQRQFTELAKQYEDSSLNTNPVENQNITKIPVQDENISAVSMKNPCVQITQHIQKGLLLIGRLQNETGSQMIPVGILTSNLYPEKLNRQIKTTVSNILKQLCDPGLIRRERRGNFWYVGLTSKGYQTIKNLLDQTQLRNLVQLYEKK